jgi:hypothetical protein
MLIKDIRDKELRELAYLRAEQFAAKRKPVDPSTVWGAFIWEQTPERCLFWGKVNNKQIVELNPLNELIIDDLALENKLLKERIRSLETLLKQKQR